MDHGKVERVGRPPARRALRLGEEANRSGEKLKMGRGPREGWESERGAEGRGQRSEDRGQRSEDRGQREGWGRAGGAGVTAATTHRPPGADEDVGAHKGEPAVGFEPTTDGLQNRCSTTELCRRWWGGNDEVGGGWGDVNRNGGVEGGLARGRGAGAWWGARW
jgi:hypothetical protein